MVILHLNDTHQITPNSSINHELNNTQNKLIIKTIKNLYKQEIHINITYLEQQISQLKKNRRLFYMMILLKIALNLFYYHLCLYDELHLSFHSSDAFFMEMGGTDCIND